MKSYISESPEQTEEIAFEFAGELENGSCVSLIGSLGAGKTAFVRGLVKRLAPKALTLVHSPTFTVVNEYKDGAAAIYHFDFYRLKSEEDLYSCGFYDYFDKDGIIVAEWGDMFPQALPSNTVTVNIEVTDALRKITIV